MTSLVKLTPFSFPLLIDDVIDRGESSHLHKTNALLVTTWSEVPFAIGLGMCNCNSTAATGGATVY